MAKALMFVGTSSESGKSIMAAAFCRILKRRGVKVAPFKSQNMALNSGVTPDGREMGRAQIVQAECAGLDPHVDMNPILLKPTSETGSQVIVHGVVYGTMDAAAYYHRKKPLWPLVTESYDRLAQQYEVIILEGAGSPVEMNLKEHDIVNMAMAAYADAAVILVADIDRGGVFASIIGTMELLEQHERKRVIGFIINKFRGDAALLGSGVQFIATKTGRPVLGIVPYMNDLYLPGEDSVALCGKAKKHRSSSALISVGVVRLPHISNYTDFDPLECDPRIALEYVISPKSLSTHEVIIVPGSKNVFYDYRFLVQQGFIDGLAAYYRRGGKIVGICGGFQMLGRSVSDPYQVESDQREIQTLGMLPVCSVMDTTKITKRVTQTIILPGQTAALQVSGYEIHMGRTAAIEPGQVRPLSPDQPPDAQAGVASVDGNIWGTYLHGLFDNDELRDHFIAWAAGLTPGDSAASFSYASFKEQNYDRLADGIECSTDVDSILKHVAFDAAF